MVNVPATRSLRVTRMQPPNVRSDLFQSPSPTSVTSISTDGVDFNVILARTFQRTRFRLWVPINRKVHVGTILPPIWSPALPQITKRILVSGVVAMLERGPLLLRQGKT